MGMLGLVVGLLGLWALQACTDNNTSPAEVDAGEMDGDSAVVDAGPACPRTSDAGYVRNRNRLTDDLTYWPREVLEEGGIPILIDPDGTPDLPSATTEDAIARAMAVWTSAAEECGAGLVVFRRVAEGEPLTVEEALGYSAEGPNMNVLTFVTDEETWRSAGRSQFTIAETNSTVRASTSDIIDVDIELNDAFFTFTDTVPLPDDGLDLQSVLIHELGHLLGFDHTQDPESVMWPTEEEGVDLKRELLPMDRAGVCEAFGCY